MSAKPTTSRGDSKLPPVKETILTRRKSAQLKRQLRNKDSSIKRISQFTQLLLSPSKANTSKSPPTKSKNSVSKNLFTTKSANVKNTKAKAPEKKDVNHSPQKRNSKGKFVKKVQSPMKKTDTFVEYYPNKLKRRFEGKKVVLKPKHEMKVVVGTRIGKRNLVLPQKGANTSLCSPPPKHQKLASPTSQKPKPHCIELSIEDLVRLHNDEMLDDEDWLEILTCPSPVWWEDPPDPGFDDEPVSQMPVATHTADLEGPVRKRNKSDPKKISQENHVNITEILSESNVKVLEMKKCDDKFMRKRSKLEVLLGNIRNKVNYCIESDHNSNRVNLKRESDVEINNTEADSDRKRNCPMSDSKSHSPVSKKVKRTSESTEEDLFSNFRDEDLLNDLENLEIPIKSDEDVKCEAKNAEFLLENNSNVGKGESYGQQKDTVEKSPDCNSSQSKIVSNNVSNTIITYKSPKIKREENNETAKLNSQINKLTTTSIEKDVSSSPVSAKSLNSMSDETYEYCSVKNQDVDTISDTNIKFIDDDDVSSSKSYEITEKKDKIVNNTQAEISNEVKNAEISNVDSANKDEEVKKSQDIENICKTNLLQNPRKEKDCMTVYKIISNERDNNKVNNKSNSVISKINELIKASKEYNSFKANLQKSEATKTKLDSFYKKHKNHQSRSIKRPESDNNNSVDIKDNDNQNIKTNPNIDINERIEMRDEKKNESDIAKENTQSSDKNHNNEEKSIIVPNSSTAIKYCLKCSCIFDTNDCNYCVEKAKSSTENHGNLCKNSMKLSTSEKNKDVESFLCDLCKIKNDE